MRDHLACRDLHLHKLGKGHVGNAIIYTKCETSKPNGFEEDFLIFLCISMV